METYSGRDQRGCAGCVLRRADGDSGDRAEHGSDQCDSGPVGAHGDDTVTIDQRAGRFMPGLNVRPRLHPFGLPEIECFVELGVGENGLTVFGGTCG